MTMVPTVTLANGKGQMPVVGLGMFLTTNEAEVSSTISTAVEVGYRHIDTAFTYKNEALIGRALKPILQDVKREDMFVVTKLPPNGLRPDAVPYFFHKSLSDLQLDYVDLYHMHFPVAFKRQENDYDFFPMKDGQIDADNVDLLDTWRAMEKLVESGEARALGVSNCNSKQIMKIYEEAAVKPQVLQVECHAYLPQFELNALCRDLNMIMTAYSPIGAPGQFSSGKNPEGRLIDDDRLKPICEKYGKTPAQVLLRYHFQRDIVVIPKSSNPKRLAENLQIFDFSLTEDDMKMLRSMAKNRRYFDFRSYAGITDHPEYPFSIPY